MKQRITAKKKQKIVKIVLLITIISYFCGITELFVMLGTADLWGDMFENGITSFGQWITLIIYRFMLYLLPGFLLAFWRFDRRYKYSSRFIIWENWFLLSYLLWKLIYQILAINLIFQIDVLNSLDDVVAIMGYILTYIKKREIELAEVGGVLGDNPNTSKMK